MNTVIKVENLSKAYQLGQFSTGTLSRDLERWWALSRGKEDPFLKIGETNDQSKRGTSNVVWSLKDINFTVEKGEAIGIIGKNGAGKSTLLKILSKITSPTQGSAKIKGRIASLLEVGTGFHPELTGRENIYLNGAILGMRKKEITRKFDEIVDFSGVERYIDTPVKRYSSGMYVRLAFAVAAHLESEIIVVDEVLAVGDAEFQKKCLGKMGNVSKGEGRTILFVSHNMQAIRQLCERAVLLQAGELVLNDEASTVIERYLREASGDDDTQKVDEIIRNLPFDPAIRLEKIKLTQNGHAVGARVESDKPLEVEICYRVFERTMGLRVYIDLCDNQDTLLFRSFHDEDNDRIPIMEPGYYLSQVIIPANMLGPLMYELRIRSTIFNVRTCWSVSGVRLPLKVELTGGYNRAYLSDAFRGKFALALTWVNKKLA